MQTAWANHCDTCHTTCGQCHISRPSQLSGGLLDGHEVVGRASTDDTCGACHGSRAVSEYRGDNEGIEGSVHWLEAGMSCDACHRVDEFHGDGAEYIHRYDGRPSVGCLECHEETATQRSTVKEHQIHGETVDCYVCHVSGPYKNCYDCHVAVDEKGLAYFETAESQMDFKIGRNPLRSEERPWEYSLVRHVPVTPDTFAFYGQDLLPAFDSLPTWTYATPHNIQRQTARTQSCEHCHNNPDVFLQTADVSPEEAVANAAVVVDQVPVLPHPGMSEYDIPGACTGCHPQATEWDWELVDERIHSLDHVVEPAGTVIACEDCHSHPGLSEYNIPDACTGCHPQAGEWNWDLVSENVHTLDHVVNPAGTVIECEDCHSPEANFDWAAAGFSAEQMEELMWTEYPAIEPAGYAGAPSSAPYWILGGGVIVAAGVMSPLIRRRNGRER
jgi:thiosulfate/3-mercaptopyruvate sulfurtransferase